MRVCSFIFFLAASIAARGAHVQDLEQNYNFNAILDDQGKYILYWNYDLELENITFAVRVQTTGWIGFGLSPNGQMPQSDVVIGWVDGSGRNFFDDRFADIRATPDIDSQQDWKLLRAEEENGYTIMEFTRKLVTCDDKDLDVMFDTSRVIWSYSSSDPSTNDPSQPFTIHEHRGSASLNLLGGARSVFQEPESITSFSITNNNVTIPHDSDTTYWCTVYSLPNVSREQEIFIYRTSPIVMEGNEDYVHHFLVYLCPPDQPVHTGDCRDIGEHIEGCYGSKLIGAWAVGGEDFYFPEGVALPLGGPNSPVSHVLIEVHYDNQQLVSGVVDSSGMEFFYTTQEPVHRASILSMGSVVNPVMMIPPKQQELIINGFCSASCLDRYLPDEGITIFANILHTHLLGTGLVVQHYTQNEECSVTEELEPIDKNLRYDFNYQEITHLPRKYVLRKGDSLELKCIYGSKERDNVTFGGIGTYEEMCLTFFFYYPEIDLATCISLPQYEQTYASFLSKYLPGNETEVESAVQGVVQGQNAAVISAFSSIDWSEEAVQEFVQGIENTDIYQVCIPSTPDPNESGEPVYYPEIKPDVSCSYDPPNQCTGYQPQSCCDRLRQENPLSPSSTPDVDGAGILVVSMTTMIALLLALTVLV